MSPGLDALDEKKFRRLFREACERVARAFENVDPDIVEFEESLGSVSLTTPKGKIILSPQPPVRQAWLAAASQGIAAHFNWDPDRGAWMDDKGKGLELFSFLSEVVEKASGQNVTI